MWGAIVALRGRYPEQLEALKDKWWTNESTVRDTRRTRRYGEQNSTKRAKTPATSSRSKTQLNDYAHLLSQKGGGVTKAWKPARPRQSGPRSSHPRSPTVTSLTRSVSALRHTLTRRTGVCTPG